MFRKELVMVEREKFEKVMAMLIQSNIELVKMYFPDLNVKEEEYVRFLTEFHLVSGPEIVRHINESRQTAKRVEKKIQQKLEEKRAREAEARRVEKAKETLDKYMPYKAKRLSELTDEIIRKELNPDEIDDFMKADEPEENKEELDDDYYIWLYSEVRKEIFR